MTNKQNAIGVIVGRFQVHKLTEGHKEILDFVLSQNHYMNILVLGNPPRDVRCTKNNPLPYVSRKRMIEEEYPGKFEICYKTDVMSDEEWSSDLDKQILAITNGNSDVILYGSRDSFIEHYTGQFETYEYQQKLTLSGTKLREELKKNIGTSEDFRRGCIYATQNNWTYYYPTVDCAIFTDDSYSKIYLAKKPGEKTLRFPGGFIDPKDNSYEEAAIREAQEETGLKCKIEKYIGSFKVKDWRYFGEVEQVMTTLFLMTRVSGNPAPYDDIAELHLCNIKDLSIDDINPAHRQLFKTLISSI